MEAFLARTVLPKLIYCLQTLVINPQNEHIGLLNNNYTILVNTYMGFHTVFFISWGEILIGVIKHHPTQLLLSL